MKVYIEINGVKYDTGRTTLKDSPAAPMTTDGNNPLVLKSMVYPVARLMPCDDGVSVLRLEGDFSQCEIDSLIANPWRIFKPLTPN